MNASTTVEIRKDGEDHDAVMELSIEGQAGTLQSVHESIRQAWKAFEDEMHNHALRCPLLSEVDIETERDGYSWVHWESEGWEF